MESPVKLDFDTIFTRLMDIEGSYTLDAHDPGGETKWGISKREYPALNIATLTKDDAKKIYFTDFWQSILADNLPQEVAYQVFDFAVNSGIITAIRYLQRALGVADDGYFGPVSKTVMLTMDSKTLILLLNAERLDFMTRLSNWPAEGKGWARRIAQNLKFGAQDS